MDEDALSQNAESLEQSVAPAPQTPQKPPKLPKKWKIYTIIIGGIVVIITGSVVAFFALHKPKPQPAPTPITINTQSLDNGTLNKLTTKANTDNTKQQLTITPDTLFKNSVEVQGALKANKNVDIGGNLSVTGTTTMQGAVGINGNTAIKGSLNVSGVLSAPSINVGSLTITTINVSGNLSFAGHIMPGGATPAVKTSIASAGGSVAVSGNDTAGTITLTTGDGGVSAGELMMLTFKTAFPGTPKVQLTPINSEASALNYYATRSAGFFTIRTSSLPQPSTTYVFDYLVTQ